MVLCEDSFNFYAYLESWMPMLFVPEVYTLENCLCNLPFDVIQREVATDRLVFGAINISGTSA